MDLTDSGHRRIPEATVARLPLYLRSLREFSERGTETVSSEKLATATDVNAAKVRKDLSYLGSYGTRGVGYAVQHLVSEISLRLGLNRIWRVGIVGAGNLGRALVNYRGFAERGLEMHALFDSNPEKVGRTIGGLEVQSVGEIRNAIATHDLHIGIIATPAKAAQHVADRLVAGGIMGILNFAPIVLRVPDEIMLRKVDLSIELQILAFYVGRDGRLGHAALEA